MKRVPCGEEGLPLLPAIHGSRTPGHWGADASPPGPCGGVEGRGLPSSMTPAAWGVFDLCRGSVGALRAPPPSPTGDHAGGGPGSGSGVWPFLRGSRRRCCRALSLCPGKGCSVSSWDTQGSMCAHAAPRLSRGPWEHGAGAWVGGGRCTACTQGSMSPFSRQPSPDCVWPLEWLEACVCALLSAATTLWAWGHGPSRCGERRPGDRLPSVPCDGPGACPGVGSL